MLQDARLDNKAILRIVRTDYASSGTTRALIQAMLHFAASDSDSDSWAKPLLADAAHEDTVGVNVSLLFPAARAPFSDGAVCSVVNCTGLRCSQGHYLNDSAGACLPCAEGTFMRGANHQFTACAVCEPGTYNFVSGF